MPPVRRAQHSRRVPRPENAPRDARHTTSAFALTALITTSLALGAPIHAHTPGPEESKPVMPDPALTDEAPGELSPAQPPTARIDEDDADELADETPGPFEWLNEGIRELEAGTGLRIGIAYTTLLQHASGAGDRRTAAAGDVDLTFRWTLLGRGTLNPGTLIFNTEYRHQIGDLPPSALASSIGAGIATTNGFSERPVVIKDAYWVQHALDGLLRFGAGRADPENFVGGHRLQSANTFFLHKAFSGNPAIAYPGSGLAAAFGIVPHESWYISAGAANAYGRVTTTEFESLFDEWDLFTFVEAGWTPRLDGLGQGRYRIALWHIDDRSPPDSGTRPDDAGVSVIIDQDIGERLKLFARYAHSDADVTGVSNLVEGGGALTGILGSQSVTGLALAFADYSSANRRDETIAEIFHRWQLTGNTQLTVGGQLILNPADSPNDDALAVFSLRLRISF